MSEFLTVGNLALSTAAVIIGTYRLFRPCDDMNPRLRFGFGLATVAAGLNALMILVTWMAGVDALQILQHKSSEVSELLVYAAVCVIVGQFGGHRRHPNADPLLPHG